MQFNDGVLCSLIFYKILYSTMYIYNDSNVRAQLRNSLIYYTDIHSTSHTMYDARERGGKMRRRKDRKNDAEERGRVI